MQIDIDGRMLSLRYPMEVNLVGDSRETLRALVPLLKRKDGPRLARADREERRRLVEVLEARAMQRRQADQPAARLLGAVAAAARRRILSGDSGIAANWFARDLKIRRGMMASLSGNLATMGPACPTPSRPSSPSRTGRSIALVGRRRDADERHQRAHHDRQVLEGVERPAALVLVLNNRDLNMVTWEQRAMAGDPKFAASQDLPDFPLCRLRASRWARRLRVERPERHRRALGSRRSRATGRWSSKR